MTRKHEDAVCIINVFKSEWTSKKELQGKIDVNKELVMKNELVNRELNCSCQYWDYPEGYTRGYESWATPLNSTKDFALSEEIYLRLNALLHNNPDSKFFFPMAIEGHPDHKLLYSVLCSIIKQNPIFISNVCLYEDLPYAFYVDFETWYHEITLNFSISPVITDIKEVFEKKIELLRLFDLQIEDFDIKATVAYTKKIRDGELLERYWKIGSLK